MNAGDIGDAGELSGLGVGDGGVDNGSLGLFGGNGGGDGGIGGDGDDHIDLIGHDLGADLVQHGGIVLAVVDFDLDLDALLGGEPFQLGLDAGADLIQGGMLQLLDDGDLENAVVGLGAAGSQGQDHQDAHKDTYKLLHNGYSFIIYYGFRTGFPVTDAIVSPYDP